MSEVNKNRSWVYIGFGYLSLLALGFVDNLRGPSFPSILHELNLRDTQGALFFSVTSTLAFISSWWARVPLKWMGSLATLAFGLFIVALSCLFISQSHTLSTLLIAAAVFGLGYGLVSVAMNVAVAEGSEGSMRSRSLSGLHSMYGLASILAPPTVALLAGLEMSWRQAFVVASVGSFLSAVVIYVRRKTPAPYREIRPALETSMRGRPRVLALWLALAVAVYQFGELSLSSRLMLYLMREEYLTHDQASLQLTLFFVGLFLSRFLLLWIPVGRQLRTVLYASLALSILVFSLGLIFDYRLLGLCGFTLGPFIPLALTHLMQLFQLHQTQLVSYTMSMFSLVIVTLHLVLGSLSDFFSISMAMWSGPFGLLLSFIMYAFGEKYYRRHAHSLEKF